MESYTQCPLCIRSCEEGCTEKIWVHTKTRQKKQIIFFFIILYCISDFKIKCKKEKKSIGRFLHDIICCRQTLRVLIINILQEYI